jgi:hypothetical protein
MKDDYQVKSTHMDFRKFYRAIFNPLVFLGGFFLALLLLSGLFLLLGWSRPGPIPGSPGTAVVNIISAPTETLMPATPTSPVEITPDSNEQGEIVQGSSVEITGTAGAGLRLRFSPGLESAVRMLGAEGEIFQVMDGPQNVDNYTWWYLENPEDRTRRGWGVADFLQLRLTP